jgi:hypothetical protein
MYCILILSYSIKYIIFQMHYPYLLLSSSYRDTLITPLSPPDPRYSFTPVVGEEAVHVGGPHKLGEVPALHAPSFSLAHYSGSSVSHCTGSRVSCYTGSQLSRLTRGQLSQKEPVQYQPHSEIKNKLHIFFRRSRRIAHSCVR